MEPLGNLAERSRSQGSCFEYTKTLVRPAVSGLERPLSQLGVVRVVEGCHWLFGWLWRRAPDSEGWRHWFWFGGLAENHNACSFLVLNPVTHPSVMDRLSPRRLRSNEADTLKSISTLCTLALTGHQLQRLP